MADSCRVYCSAALGPRQLEGFTGECMAARSQPGSCHRIVQQMKGRHLSRTSPPVTPCRDFEPRRLRPGDRRLRKCLADRSEERPCLQQPRRRLPRPGRVRPGHGRLQQGDRARSKARGCIFNRGTLYMQKEDYNRAVADYSAVIRQSPKDVLALAVRGRAWSGKEDLGRAKADFEAALAVSAEDERSKAVQDAVRELLQALLEKAGGYRR